jgi:hypothetical protein
MVRQPRSRTVALGSYFTLNAAVTGSSPLVYEWYKDGTLLCTSPKSDLYVESAQLYDAGNYQVVVRNAYGTATSVTARITVEPEQPVLTASIDETGNAVLTILGRAGARYRIECADSIAEESPVWRTVATVTATTNPFSWADATAVFFAHRFYRVAEDEVVFP